MPREPRLSRAVLYGCGASVLLMMAPQFGRIPSWESAVLVLALGWKLFSVWRGSRMPRLLLPALALIIAAGVFMSYGTFIGRVAGSALLVAMLMMKYLETHTTRDATLVVFLSYFVVVTNFLFEQGIAMGIYLLIAIVVCTLTLLSLHSRGEQPDLRLRTRWAVTLVMQAIPIAVILFVLFPRLSGPLWGIPEDGTATTGLSDQMAPGTITSLSQSTAPAFRVKFAGPVPAHETLYWRGPVLWRYDGAVWRTNSPPNRDPTVTSVLAVGSPVDYSVTVQPHGRRWVFALDAPTRVPSGTRITSDMQVLAVDPVVSVRRYDMTSHTQFELGKELPPLHRQAALQLPTGSNPRLRTLAQELRDITSSDIELVNTVLRRFREQPYVYTLTPPSLGVHAMDEFLFDTLRGFCEHYASAFVLLMRAAGVPARVVTGYMGGELNDLGEYLLVRQADAHAWAEVWIDRRGWLRVDPTAAVSPSRIEDGIVEAFRGSGELPLLIRPEAQLLKRLTLVWDSINNGWNDWVLGYGPELQRHFFRNLGFGGYDAVKAAALLVVSVGILLLLVALIPHWRHNRIDPVLAAYMRFCRRLARAGLVRHSDEGPLQFAARAGSVLPEHAAHINLVTGLFVKLRYAASPAPELARQFRQQVNTFRVSAGGRIRRVAADGDDPDRSR